MWRKFEELRKIDNDVCALLYPKKYAEDNNIENAIWAKLGDYVGIMELMEFRINDKKLEWRYVDLRQREMREKTDKGVPFKTQYGTFYSDNQGEFGGKLETPQNKVLGTFEEVFDFGKYVIGIDSCAHLGTGYINIYVFDENLDYKIIYSNKNTFIWNDFNFFCFPEIGEDSHYETHSINENGILTIFAPSERMFDLTPGGYKRFAKFSYIINIDENLNVTEIEVDYYNRASKVMLYDNKVILGVDKEIVIYNLKNMEKEIYTALSDERIKILCPIEEIKCDVSCFLNV